MTGGPATAAGRPPPGRGDAALRVARRRRGEGGALAALQLDGEPRRRRALGDRRRLDLGDAGRLGEVDDHPRLARPEQAEAESLDDRLGARSRGRPTDGSIWKLTSAMSTTMRSGSTSARALAATGPERSKTSFAVSPSSASRAATATGGASSPTAAHRRRGRRRAPRSPRQRPPACWRTGIGPRQSARHS